MNIHTGSILYHRKIVNYLLLLVRSFACLPLYSQFSSAIWISRMCWCIVHIFIVRLWLWLLDKLVYSYFMHSQKINKSKLKTVHIFNIGNCYRTQGAKEREWWQFLRNLVEVHCTSGSGSLLHFDHHKQHFYLDWKIIWKTIHEKCVCLFRNKNKHYNNNKEMKRANALIAHCSRYFIELKNSDSI